MYTPCAGEPKDSDKNLYITGAAWWVGSSASSTESYNCYKIVAKGLGLGKPGEEPGKEEPDPL